MYENFIQIIIIFYSSIIYVNKMFLLFDEDPPGLYQLHNSKQIKTKQKSRKHFLSKSVSFWQTLLVDWVVFVSFVVVVYLFVWLVFCFFNLAWGQALTFGMKMSIAEPKRYVCGLYCIEIIIEPGGRHFILPSKKKIQNKSW